MTDVDRIRGVKRRAAARLHAIPGVHAVGVGGKIVGGRDSGELAVAVFVLTKKKPEELSEAELVPSEIDGVKTDVVEMPRIRLLNADPTSVQATVSQLPPGEDDTGGIVTLSGQAIPDEGIVVVVDLTVQHLDHAAKNQCAFAEASKHQTLAQLAKELDKNVNQLTGAAAEIASATPNVVKITAMPDYTVNVTRAYVLAADINKYFKDYVRGGISIEPGGTGNGSGTLGCIATTAPTEQYPEGMVVGLTNFHVVCPSADDETNLSADVQSDLMSVQFLLDGDTVDEGTLVLLLINDDPPPANLIYSAFYVTKQGDTAASVVSAILAMATNLPTGSNLSQADQTDDDPPTISLTGRGTLGCKTFGPPIPDPDANLHSSVSRPILNASTIKFEGQVSTEDYGIFVKINPGGLKFTVSSFTNPQKGQTPESVAQAVCDSITGLPAELLGTITASSSGKTVQINNIEHVECRILSDIRVGQPDDDFGSTCSQCCSHRIGRILDAQVHSDVALIQLDPKLEYKLEIQGISGGIKANSSALQKGLEVQKHGRTTGTTKGSVNYVEVSTDVEEDNGLVRLLENGFIISGDTADAFSLPGDSGSAILSAADNSLVGLLWGHSNAGGTGTAIGPLVDAFPKLQLSFAPAPGDNADTVQTVPASIALRSVDGAVAGAASTPHVILGGDKFAPGLDEAENEIRATPLGREFAEVVRRHLQEGFTLVNKNRRVATVWHRSGGPEILNALARMIQFRNERLPAEINGKPLAECLSRIERIVTRYASPAFLRDLNRYAPRAKDFARMSYLELLAAFQSEATE
jgi:hypothetical protein